MTTESDIKFGPEWLRNLTHGSTTTSPPTSPAIKYPKPEHSYGREEMLSFFTTATDYVAFSEDCKSLHVSNRQFPIAFEAQTEDERDIWASTNINSELALKSAGKHGIPNGDRLGRGGIRGTGALDRGRGRSSRPFFRHDDDDGGYQRPRMNDRQLPPFEKDNRWDDRERRFNNRSFSNRGNIEEIRKDGGASVDNWRKPDKDREAEEPIRRNYSGPREKYISDKDREAEEPPVRRNYSGQRDNFSPGRNNWRKIDNREDDRYKPSLKPLTKKSWEDDQNRGFLPEWIEEGQDDKTGSFDASGAFRNNSSEEDEGLENEHLDSKNNSNVGLATSKDDFEEPKSEIALSPIKTLPLHQSVVIPPEKLQTPTSLPNLSNTAKVESELSSHSSPSIAIPISSSTPSKSQSLPISPQISMVQSLKEEVPFAHLKSPKENMISQWNVKEEEQRQMIPGNNKHSMERFNSLPLKHVNAHKWFYNDPQGKIQGPFSSEEMLEWYNVGYFDTYLLVRRGCDETFAQIGELSKIWGVGNPFLPALQVPPALRAVSQNNMASPLKPMMMAGPPPQVIPSKPEFNHSIVQQQQQMHQYMYRQILSKLKTQEEFNNLPPNQQTQIAMQQLLHQMEQQQKQQQPQLPSRSTVTEIPNMIDPLASLQLNNTNPKELKHMWNMAQLSANWPLAGMPPSAPNQAHSPAKYQYWDAELDKEKRLTEETELRKLEEQKKLLEDERRKHEEELRRQEEERQHLEELRLQQEEEKRKLMELKQKQEEQDRQFREQMRLQEEKRIQEERRRLLEEKIREEKRLMEERLQEERIRKEKEQKKLEENKIKEEMRRREEELRRQKEHELRLELERREREQHIQEQKKRQQIEQEMARLQQQQQLLLQQQAHKQHQAAVWAIPQPSVPLSLAEIQKLEEEKDKEEKRIKAIRQNQQIQQQQATQKLTWAQRSVANAAPAKSLDEIQKEEADKLELLKQNKLKAYPPVSKPVNSLSMGAWNNGTSHITHSLNPTGNVWDFTPVAIKQPVLASENSDFPPVNKTVKQPQQQSSSNKSKVNSQNKKEKESVIKIKIQPEPSTDEFTKWCLVALKSFTPPVDIPTYVSFLKDIESPYDVNDYVKSYLGDTKESREFAKNFLENRSKYRNQKKKSEEEGMWGPAPAVNPTPKTATVKNNDTDPSGSSNPSNNKGKKKKNKKMQKVDNSLLGFTVTQDNRINVLGESDQIAG